MERSSIYIVLVASFFTTTLATLTTQQNYLHNCAANVGEQCGKQFYSKLFTHNKTTITRDCCYKILQTGYSCHNKMTVFILESDPKFKNVDRTDYLTKSDHIFQKCNRVIEPENEEFLAKCVEKVGVDCGEEIFSKLINDKKISKHCCKRLVKTGEKCHTGMVKAWIRTPTMRNIDAFQFLKKHKKIFNDCKYTG